MPTPDEALDKAFQDTVSSIAPEMLYLMHGAGDVPPNSVNPATAQLVAALTVQYMGKLVDAAIDSHEMLSDSVAMVTHPLPPPAFPRSRQPPKPLPPTDDTKNTGPAGKALAFSSSSKKRRARDEYRDEPLPEPKIRKKNKRASIQESARQSQVDNSSTAAEPVNVDEWVGLAGVDLLENRARSAYVQGPAVMSTQSFVFPICHDVYTYGRVIEMQASKRSLRSLLIDPVVTELARVEGRQEHHHHKKKSETGDASDPEEADEEASAEEDEREMPSWPGLDDVLPTHRRTAGD